MGASARVALALAALLSGPALPGRATAAIHDGAGAWSGEPRVRWTFGPLGFEREPLALDPEGARLVVTGREPTGRRAVVVLDGTSGRVLGRTLFAASEPLALAAAGDRVAVRSNPRRVDVYRLRGARLLAERGFAHAESLSAPVLAGDRLVLREGGELACYALDRREPLWRARVPGAFHGTPAIDGATVLAAWTAEGGVAYLAELGLANGDVVGNALLGRPADGSAPAADAGAVFAHAEAAFVRLGSPLPATSGVALPWARVERGETTDGTLGVVTLHPFLAEPLELPGVSFRPDGSRGSTGSAGSGWVAPELGRDGKVRWVLVRAEGDAQRAIELAAPDHHAWLTAARAPASRAGDVMFLGPAAADAHSLAVLWRRDAVPAFRPVPVAGGLLVVEGDRLRLLGGPPEPADPAAERARGERERAERALGERLGALAAQALRGGDRGFAEELVGEVEALGATGRTLDLVRGELERSGATAGASGAAADSRRRAALEREAEAARAALPDALVGAADRASDSRLKRALLTELFRIAPEHPGGRAELLELLPRIDARTFAAGGDARAWLEFLEHAAVRPIEPVTDPRDPGRAALEREGWRPDAHAYRSARLVVVTAGTRSGSVARTMRTGELLCDALGVVFGGERASAGPLELVLYPTRAEYLAHSGSDLGGLESVLGFTAGHFDLGARVSRLYLPPEDHDGGRLIGVTAHELTHHWLAMRSSFGPSRSTSTGAGFWIVEGIATWAEELALDVEQGTWSTAPWRSASLDTVAAAGPADRLDWSRLLAASFEDYCRLETRATCRLPLAWQLGSAAPRGPMQLFYAQSAALAHWLYEADGGRYRGVLVRAVEGYYRGAPVDVARELGMTAEELGERVVGFARGVMRAE